MKNLFTLLVLSLLTVPSFAARYHVKTTGSDAAAGTNWTAAFATLQKALATATSGDEIWVAAGTYYPDEGPGVTDNDRNAHFTMKNGVAIYGGFPATGIPTMTNRNWINNPTILSGEIQQDNDISNNTYNIIYNFFNNLDATSLLDGFTVSGGCAYGIEFRTYNGGGVHNRNTAPAFQNCTFSGNQAIFGGGMYNEESSPTLVNCSFQANEANNGGGMYNVNVPQLSLTNCSFSGNKAREGGGITTSTSSLTLINCSFSANQANAGGALYNDRVSSLTSINCSFSGNKAISGGALYNNRVSSLTLTNCIIWGNSTPQVSNPAGVGVYAYSHCLIEGLNPSGVGNLDGTQPTNNPLFVSQPDFNTAPTTTGNLRLQPCSPAINAGTNGSFTNADKDLDGNTRIVNTTVDLGAYEAQAAAVFHVKPTGSDANNGLCWNTAFRTLQKALESAFSGTTIWVAAGTYYPDEGPGVTDNDRNAHFTMKNGVAIYGGFPATGNPTMTDRNWINNPTILSGEIQQDNDISNNTYNIIYNFFNNLDATSLLDGFTVSAGYAYGGDFRTKTGGGVHNRNTAPAFQNCTFSGNRSIAYGGGMYNEESFPTLVNCSFQANEAIQYGGAVCNINVPSFTLTNCSFSGNKAGFGGGIYTQFIPSLTLINCSFSANQADTGGALYNDRVSSLTLTNCIIWGNSTSQIRNLSETSVYSHCLIEGLNPSGIGNLDGTNPTNNPLFVNQPDFNAAPTTTGNLRLQICSPAINAGTNGSFTNTDKDLDNNPRLFDSLVDLGAYELQTIKSIPTATISGTTSVCQNSPNSPITFTGSGGTAPYTFTYTINGGSPQTVSTNGSNSSVTIYQSTDNAGIFNYTLTGVSDAVGCSKNQNETSAVTVYPMPTATISGPAKACQNATAPSITFTGSGGTAPYTFTYTINGGNPQTVSTVGSNTSVAVSQPTNVPGNYIYTLLSVSDAQCSQNQSGYTTIEINVPPALGTTPAVLCTGQTFNLTPASGGTWISSNSSKATVSNAGLVTGIAEGIVYFTFSAIATGCSASTPNITIKPTPASALTASKVDVCPNTPVTLDAHCSIPSATVNWNPGAPTVTPNAATIPYIYKATCTKDGCVGNESSVEVRTHRILVDMKDLDPGPLPKPIVRSVIDNLAPANLISSPTFPRRWTFIAHGCNASESAVFKLTGPVNISTVDNDLTYAMFSNEGSNFYSLAHPNYGNGGSFPNGTYTLIVDLRSADGAGGPFPKNRIATGSLLATRTLQFTVGNTTTRKSAEVLTDLDHTVLDNLPLSIAPENWLSIAENPVSKEIKMYLTGNAGEETVLTFVTPQGQTLFQRSLQQTTAQQYEVLDVRNFPLGVYFLKAVRSDKVKTFKIIKAE